MYQEFGVINAVSLSMSKNCIFEDSSVKTYITYIVSRQYCLNPSYNTIIVL